jgi:cobalamin synthase
MRVIAAQPASLATLAEAAHGGLDMDRGQHPRLARAAAVYGYTVAVPLSVACYAAAWIVQRPARLALALAVLLVVWLS